MKIFGISFSIATLIFLAVLYFNAGTPKKSLTAEPTLRIYVWSGDGANFTKVDFDKLVEQSADADVILLRDLGSSRAAYRMLDVVGLLSERQGNRRFCKAWLATQAKSRQALLWRQDKLERWKGGKPTALCPGKAIILPIDTQTKSHHVVLKHLDSEKMVSLLVPLNENNKNNKQTLAQFERLLRASNLVEWPTILLGYTNLKAKELGRLARDTHAVRLSGTSVFLKKSDLEQAEWFEHGKSGGKRPPLGLNWRLEERKSPLSAQVNILRKHARSPSSVDNESQGTAQEPGEEPIEDYESNQLKEFKLDENIEDEI